MARLMRILLIPLALALLLVTGCGDRGSDTLVLTGTVVAEPISIQTPEIPQPKPADGGAASQEGTRAMLASDDTLQSRSRPDYMWLMVNETPVRPGDQVITGDPLAVFDGELLAADVAQANAALAASEADLALLGVTLTEASSGLQSVESQRSQLSTQVADLQQQRVEILVELEKWRQLVGSTVPTGTPDPAEKVVELEKALAVVDAGINQANEALAKLNESGGELGDLVSALEGAERAASAIVDIRRIMVQMAEMRLEQATVRAPASGQILMVSPAGTVLAPRAPVATMNPDTPVTIRTWVTAEQRALITLGATAMIGADSLGDAQVSGAVTDIGVEYQYVPTTFATQVIHMIRGFEVKIVVYGDAAPPPGTPVDVTIQTIGNSTS